jgi:hypothetical protein
VRITNVRRFSLEEGVLQRFLEPIRDACRIGGKCNAFEESYKYNSASDGGKPERARNTVVGSRAVIRGYIRTRILKHDMEERRCTMSHGGGPRGKTNGTDVARGVRWTRWRTHNFLSC